MAANLKCPNCGRILREEGDESKRQTGADAPREYRVYDSAGNSKSMPGQYRLIVCLCCYHVTTPDEFSKG